MRMNRPSSVRAARVSVIRHHFCVQGTKSISRNVPRLISVCGRSTAVFTPAGTTYVSERKTSSAGTYISPTLGPSKSGTTSRRRSTRTLASSLPLPDNLASEFGTAGAFPLDQKECGPTRGSYMINLVQYSDGRLYTQDCCCVAQGQKLRQHERAVSGANGRGWTTCSLAHEPSHGEKNVSNPCCIQSHAACLSAKPRTKPAQKAAHATRREDDCVVQPGLGMWPPRVTKKKAYILRRERGCPPPPPPPATTWTVSPRRMRNCSQDPPAVRARRRSEVRCWSAK